MSVPFGYYQGNRSEYLAMYALSSFGFVVPVPRQSDQFNVDFLVHLGQEEGRRFVPRGLTFGVQNKSEALELLVEGDEKLRVLYDSNLPLFLSVVSKEGGTMFLYTMLPRFRCSWALGARASITLVPGGTVSQFHQPDFTSRRAFLGPPILEIDIGLLDDQQQRGKLWQTFSAVMDFWVQMECFAISWKRQNIPIVALPEDYQANQAPPSSVATRFYIDARADPPSASKAINACVLDLKALRKVLEKASRGAPQGFGQQGRAMIGQGRESAKRCQDELGLLREGLFPAGPPDARSR